jgi:protein-S-isoprenylcysteine O-methyltransferase Ste14
MAWVGLVLAVAGFALAGRSAILLAGRGRPRRGPRPRFVIAGPYRRVRNPLLGGLLAGGAGLAMASGSLAMGAAMVPAAALCHLWVTRVEEPRLRQRFGRAYEVYLETVPRWLPT